MISDLTKCPWPWFGGKRDAAPVVWEALGDVDHYVEPFAGSLAVLLCRRHPCNRPYFSETVNDLDGFVCNFWRALAKDPDAVADAASWPVCEADLHARHLALLAWRSEATIERLMGDPDFCDARIAGWWAWGLSCWIGSGWCSGNGSWVVGADGRITKRAKGDGVARKIPHVGNGGQGVNRPQLREPGVARQIPHVGNDGQGVNHPGCREEGVGEDEFHPMTMLELRRWLRFLAARLRHVRVLNGHWERSVTSGVMQTLTVRQGGHCGLFLDPPYATDVRTADVYAHDSGSVAAEVRAWCRENGDNPRYRIVLAGYDTEHVELESLGWTVVEWFKAGFLKGGMAQQSAKGTQQKRERLWLSPHCLRPAAEKPRQQSLFGGDR